MAITLSPKQQTYVEDLMREGAFESEEIVIDEAPRALHEEQSAERVRKLAERGIASYREHGSLPGGDALRKRVDEIFGVSLRRARGSRSHQQWRLNRVLVTSGIYHRRSSHRYPL